MIRRLAILALPALLLLSNACITREDRLRQISSGHVGCAPEKIAISDDSGGAWLAACKDRTFRCSTSGGSAVYHRGYTTPSGGTYGGGFTKTEGTAHCTEDKEASTAAQEPTAPAAPITVHHGAARFTVPGEFRADPYKGHKTYHSSSGWDRFVYLDTESYAGTAEDYLSEKLPDAKTKKFKVSGEIAVVGYRAATIFKTAMRVATMVRVVSGDAYAFTCAATAVEDESEEPDVPAFCVTTFKSLRIDNE